MGKPNVILIISDTLRADYLGCYGNQEIHTPCLDAFAERSIRFTRAYPESLPTIPFRRAMHTGRRAYPFFNYKPVKWDVVYLPGWQPMDNDEDTLAETLAGAGYHTGFVTDTLPYFAPGFNFRRGFWQWEFIRGQQQDRWRSPHSVPDEALTPYGDPAELKRNANRSLVARHVANTSHVKNEQDTSTARTFQWAMDFLEDNQNAQPFYLMVDCFDPHEPWDAPKMYYDMYADPEFDGRFFVHARYAPAERSGYTKAEVENMRANYSGLVSLVDTWFGMLIDKLDRLGLSENTAVFFISDHGTNFCDNPRNVIGKPSNSMYPGVMHLPLLVYMPDRNGAGKTCNELVYNVDVIATIEELTGIADAIQTDGRSLMSLLGYSGLWQKRDYLTCRYGHDLCCIDDNSWILTNIDGKPQEIFALQADPRCQTDVSQSVDQKVFSRAWERILADAGGELPDYRGQRQTDAIGQKK